MIVGALVVAAMAVTAVVILTRGSTPAAAARRLDPALVAVLPFRVAGADPSLHYLRQGMVDLMQAKLTGAGGARAADARSVLAAYRDAGGTDTDDVADAGLLAVAERVGAARVLQGSIVGPPDHIVMSASLVEMPGGRSIAQTTVEGPRDSLFSMVDQLATRLLALGAGASAQQLASLTTTNSEALRAYLDGVMAYRRGAFGSATRDLTRAVEIDSTFALALSALAEANGWEATSIDIRRVRRLAWQYRDRLGPRDQEVLSIRLGSQYPASTPWQIRIADRERLTRRFPESPEAWYYLADALFHYGYIADHPDPMPAARRGFEEAVRLDSAFGGPVSHLSTLAFLRGDSAEVRKWATRSFVLDTTSRIAEGLRAEIAISGRNRKELDALRAELATRPSDAALTVVEMYHFDSVTAASVEELQAIAGRQLRTDGDRLEFAQHMARGAANRGRPAEWRRWLDSARIAAPAGHPLGRAFGRTGVIGALFWGGDSTGLDELAGMDASTGIGEVTRVYVDLARGRVESVDRAVSGLRGGPGRTGTVSFDSLHTAALVEAWAEVERGSEDAVRALGVADSMSRGRETNSDWGSILLARLYERTGRPEKALTALRRRPMALGTFLFDGAVEAKRLEGRLAAKLGRKDEAISAYRMYLWWRVNPEPSKIPQRDSVRAELSALVGSN
jgi:tetratricopeptide (TPR) repeat protein